MSLSIPATQRAVQLIGPDELILNDSKAVYQPNDHQILCKVVVVGLCFSDLKLLKQFSGHVRKSEVIGGIEPLVLDEYPAYVPGDAPTVPGHEPVVEILEVGSKVTHFKPGERYMIQADWRWITTTNSNGAFGYNFEGALQEYVLLDERIVISPEGTSMLLSAPASQRAASAFALAEPWACGEDAYQEAEAKGDIAAALHERIWPLIEAGKIKPVVQQSFPLADAAKAHTLLEANEAAGKLVLIVDKELSAVIA